MRRSSPDFRVSRYRQCGVLPHLSGVSMRRQRLSSGDFVRVLGVAAGLLATACSGNASLSPTSPSLGATAGESAIANGGPGLPFIAVAGTGAGRFNLVHTESDRGGFTGDSQLTISVTGVPPNTVLYVLRAGDLGLPGGQQADGVCQRAAAGLFGPVPVPGGGSVTLETSAGGSGATHVHLFGTSEGNTLDAVFRLVDALPPAVPTVDLRTPCFTFTVK